MCLFFKKSKIVSLPDQTKLCLENNSACRYVELKLSDSRWEKRLAVFMREENGNIKILIYKEPLLGTEFLIGSSAKFVIKKNSDEYLVKISADKRTLEIKLDGKDASLWVGAIASSDFSKLTHTTHKTAQAAEEKISPETKTADKDLGSELKDKPEEQVYTGTRSGFVKLTIEEQSKPQKHITIETKQTTPKLILELDQKSKDNPKSKKSMERKPIDSDPQNKFMKKDTSSEEKRKPKMAGSLPNNDKSFEGTNPKKLEPAVFEDATLGDADPKMPEFKDADDESLADGDEKKKAGSVPTAKKAPADKEKFKIPAAAQSDEGSLPNAK